MKDIERLIERANGHMAMEGMPLSDEDKARMRRCGLDREKIQQTVAELVQKHTVKDGHGQ